MRGLSFDGVFDIETAKWDEFVLGAVLYANGDYHSYKDEEALFWAILEKGGQIWSHNGGRFDILWWLGIAARVGIKVKIQLAGSRVVRATSGHLTLRDSLALVPMQLARAATIAGLEKSQVGFECRCAEACGGYCRISKDMSEGMYRTLDGYLEHDCRITLAMLQTLKEYADANGILLRGTVGGSAWATAKSNLSLPNAQWDTSRHYYHSRAGYYGGRCQVFRPITQSGSRYDMNSAYSAALARVELPIGECAIVSSDMAKTCFNKRREGIYHVTVDTGQEFIPPLPWRTESGRVCYPTGKVTGYWARIELEKLPVEEFHSAIVWEAKDVVMAPWVERIYALRAKAGKKTGIGEWLKFVLNSFTGKTSQDPDMYSAHVNPSQDAIRYCEAKFPCTIDKCSGKCKSWRCIDSDGRIWASPFWRLSDSSHVQWAAYLTAQTRLTLLERLTSIDAIYCDTDCAYSVERCDDDVGDELGQWAYEGGMKNWLCIAPKVYRYTTDDGETVARCKGISDLDTDTWERFSRGESVVRERGVKTFLSAAKQGNMFTRKRIERRSLADGVRFGDRVLNGALTYPLDRAKLIEHGF